MQSENKLITDTKKYITQFFKENIAKKYVFHDLQHTRNVVKSVLRIGEAYSLSKKKLEILQLAAWFHDVGYLKGRDGHEARGSQLAEDFLTEKNYPPEDIAQVKACILATKAPHHTENLLQEIICDADLSHLGKRIYWDRCGRLRHELALTQGKIMSEEQWIDFELKFLLTHEFHTKIGASIYNKRKKKHIKQLRKQKRRLNSSSSKDNVAKIQKKQKKADVTINNIRLGRGVETMYRSAYKTHISLSAIADNKANIMLSISAIILSIIVGTLMPRFEDDYNLILPTTMLSLTCLVAMVFAILATRPKITEGKFSREDIETRKANLLFFGNFHDMPLPDFQWGMTEMIKNPKFLYNSMTKDLYFLGVVLAKKYHFLSICYNVFMFGMILSVCAFVAASIW